MFDNWVGYRGNSHVSSPATHWASSAERETKAHPHFFVQTRALPTATFFHRRKRAVISALILVDRPSHSAFPGEQWNTAFRKQSAFFPQWWMGEVLPSQLQERPPQVPIACTHPTRSSRGLQQVTAGWISAAHEGQQHWVSMKRWTSPGTPCKTPHVPHKLLGSSR